MWGLTTIWMIIKMLQFHPPVGVHTKKWVSCLNWFYAKVLLNNQRHAHVSLLILMCTPVCMYPHREMCVFMICGAVFWLWLTCIGCAVISFSSICFPIALFSKQHYGDMVKRQQPTVLEGGWGNCAWGNCNTQSLYLHLISTYCLISTSTQAYTHTYHDRLDSVNGLQRI